MVRDLLSSQKGLSLRRKLLSKASYFLKQSNFCSWKDTLSTPNKAVTTVELCFLTDYQDKPGFHSNIYFNKIIMHFFGNKL